MATVFYFILFLITCPIFSFFSKFHGIFHSMDSTDFHIPFNSNSMQPHCSIPFHSMELESWNSTIPSFHGIPCTPLMRAYIGKWADKWADSQGQRHIQLTVAQSNCSSVAVPQKASLEKYSLVYWKLSINRDIIKSLLFNNAVRRISRE